MSLCRLGATTALTLVLAAVISCSSQSATETSGTVPTQLSTPSPELLPVPLPDHLIETLDPITDTPAIGQRNPSPVAGTVPPVPQGNLIWRLSSADNGPFKAGEELSLILDLDPQNLDISGIQFGLNYPGELLQLREIVPGGILGPDPIVVDKVDKSDSSPAQAQERVLFAMARRGDTVAPTRPGRVALVKMLTRQEIPENGNVMIWLDRVKLTNGDFQTIGQDSVSWSLSGPG